MAVSLVNYGLDAAFVTRLPDNDLTVSALRTLRGYGVDVSHVRLGGERMGVYFVEKGASQRPSKVIYDRKYSAISTAAPGDFDWNVILPKQIGFTSQASHRPFPTALPLSVWRHAVRPRSGALL